MKIYIAMRRHYRGGLTLLGSSEYLSNAEALCHIDVLNLVSSEAEDGITYFIQAKDVCDPNFSHFGKDNIHGFNIRDGELCVLY
jgi:hypothetical protein